ncbi:glycosyltransferase [Methylobacterium iners]|nr:glycosyltransferase [Methylobacterium iners]
MSIKALVYSDYAAHPKVYNSAVYEFCKVICEIEEAQLIAPPTNNKSASKNSLTEKFFHKIQRNFKATRPPRTSKAELTSNCDLFIFVAANIDSLAELNNLSGWRARSGIKVAYIIEIWSHMLKDKKPYVEILSNFDFIYTLHANTANDLHKMTGIPCAFLPTAVDALEASPYPNTPARTIDVLSIGRRSETVHKELLQISRKTSFFYDYDSVNISNTSVYDWSEHRFLTFSKIKRAKYFVCFDHMLARGHKFSESRGDQVIPSRLFEGAACGAIMIGSAPQCPEFERIFHWPDAVIALPSDPKEILDFLTCLNADHERIAKLQTAGVVESLRSNDWSHRWSKILNDVGAEQPARLLTRLSRLEAHASMILSLPV